MSPADELALLWGESKALSLDDLAVVEHAAVLAMTEGLPPGDPARVAAAKAAHQLTAVSTFGFASVPGLMRDAESLLVGTGPCGVTAGVRLAGLAEQARTELIAGPRPVARTVPTRAARPGRTAAVVENDPATAGIIAACLRRLGCAVTVYPDGPQAAAALCGPEAAHPDLILLDVDLPGRNGMSVLRQLHTDGTTTRAAIVMITARSGPMEVAKAFRLGARAHIGKPFSVLDLALTVTEVFGSLTLAAT